MLCRLRLRFETTNASTATGLQTTVNVIRRVYETGRKVTDNLKATMPIRFDALLTKWTYIALPQ